MYDPACANIGSKYGRRVRRGVWPADSTAVEWRLHRQVWRHPTMHVRVHVLEILWQL
jgi:hypothetical protein